MVLYLQYKQRHKPNKQTNKMEKRIKQINKQLDRLDRELLWKNNRLKELSDEGMRGCSEYMRIIRESVAINDQIRNMLNELYEIVEA